MRDVKLNKVLKFLQSTRAIEAKNNMSTKYTDELIETVEPYTQNCFGCKHKEQYNFQEPCLTCVHIPRFDNFELKDIE